MRSQDEERRRIARELHDSLGQYLAAVSMELHRWAEDRNRQLTTALNTLETCITETRKVRGCVYREREIPGLVADRRWR